MLRRPTGSLATAGALLLALAATAVCLPAQGGGGRSTDWRNAPLLPPLQVRTFTLQSLSPEDAAKLVGPYVSALFTGGVFEAGGIHAITVRGTAEILVRVDSLLKANDRPRATITFRFQLIAASDSAVRDPAIAGLDAELHGLLRFAGYRLLAQGTATANDQQPFELTLGGSSTGEYQVSGTLTSVQASGGKGSTTLRVALVERPRMGSTLQPGRAGGVVLSTGLTVPLGQTVVIGSAAAGGSIPALVLAVRPEVAAKP